MSKYNNRYTELDGFVFASQLEADHYQQLKILQYAGEIKELKIHPRYKLVVNGVKIASYVGDFSYVEGGDVVVVDCKSPVTITSVYKMKRALMLAIYGIKIREVTREMVG